MQHIVMFSGGIGSWAAAKRVAAQHGREHTTLLFADVRGNTREPHVGEDEDLYRFIDEAADNVGAPLVKICEGRNIWQVFHDKRYLGNSRQANCSHILKQEPCRRWVETCYHDPAEAVIYVGIGWFEIHRLDAVRENWAPYAAEAPLTEPPYLEQRDMLEWAKREGLRPPRLYELGAAHNNCGGGCVRAGMKTFRRLLFAMPERYAEWERREAELRDYLGKPVTILRDWKTPGYPSITLREYREKIQGNQLSLFDDYDEGGCGCFTDYPKGEPDPDDDWTPGL